MIELLKLRPGYVITPFTVYINAAVFLALVLVSGQVMLFPAQMLAVYGGNYGPWTAAGEWWRLLTSVYVHGGLLHLVFNSIILVNIGFFLEPLLGRLRYLGLYLITGVMASLSSLWFNYGVVSVGASGAIFGLYGFFFALLVTGLFPRNFRKQFLRGTLVFIGINLALGFTLSMVDNAAHVGGLISGFVLGLMATPWLRRKRH